MPPATRDRPLSAEDSAPRLPARFATTHWSMVLRAGRHDTAGAGEALSRLCQVYWYPLYAQVRRRGYSAHDAQDLTQSFFARLLAHDTLARADPQRGRFRSFVLTALKNFLNDEHEKSQARKRGGGQVPVSIDVEAAERQLHTEPADAFAPDKAFDRQWAVVLLEFVLARLESEYRTAGKASQFAVLKQALTGASDAQPYAKLAADLGASEGAVKVHRLRRRFVNCSRRKSRRRSPRRRRLRPNSNICFERSRSNQPKSSSRNNQGWITRYGRRRPGRSRARRRYLRG